MIKKLLLLTLIFCSQIIGAQTIGDLVSENPNLSEIAAIIEGTTFSETLNSDGPFTFFAPSNAALATIPAEDLQAIIDSGDLEAQLLSSVVPSAITFADIEIGTTTATTLADTEVEIVKTEGLITYGGAPLSAVDMVATNGVLHVLEAGEPNMPPPAVDNSILDIITASEEHTALEAAINVAGLAEALEGEGPLTIFAPTDEAFEILGDGVLQGLLDDPDALAAILSYHVVPGAQTSTDIAEVNALTTIAGTDVSVFVSADGSIFLDDEFARINTANIIADNGIVHVIDVVMTPPAMNGVIEAIEASMDHTTLNAALDAAGLKVALSGDGPFTVFAPTDDAFAALPDGVLDALLADPTGDLVQVLYNHIVGAEVLAEDLTDGSQLLAFSGSFLNFTVGDDGVFVNETRITSTDITTDNGIIHIVDAIVPTVEEEVEVGVERLSSSNITLYPVPADEQITISAPFENTREWDLNVFDTTGKQVISKTIFEDNTLLDIRALSSGTYIIRLNSDKQTISKTFMVR